ncbi:MAG: group 1 truncated hemoglobin [Myxococcales bacterium]|nr:group 1 truncated hemoglobin [Myxococcales bacterium]MCB9713248.1 group 1 truncated hemoglobin [Myxococcales bacterium]
MSSLFERLGGEAAITKTVIEFYDRVMADETLSPFFDDVDIDRQANKMIAFVTMAFGGPHEYSGRDLRTAHARLVDNGLGEAHFIAVASHLRSTLADLGVAEPLIEEAIGIVATTHDDVLGL